ncbi:MAG: hypothetical protein AAF581_10230 [Planctomycetota bacterium]
MSGLSGLTARERDVVKQCLRAAAVGSFFPEFEFLALIGATRPELSALLDEWPGIDDTDEHVHAVINNTLLHLISYPHHREADWPNYIEVPVDEVGQIYAKWHGGPPGDSFDLLE